MTQILTSTGATRSPTMMHGGQALMLEHQAQREPVGGESSDVPMLLTGPDEPGASKRIVRMGIR